MWGFVFGTFLGSLLTIGIMSLLIVSKRFDNISGYEE